MLSVLFYVRTTTTDYYYCTVVVLLLLDLQACFQRRPGRPRERQAYRRVLPAWLSLRNLLRFELGQYDKVVQGTGMGLEFGLCGV